jgi:hypothetical protein
LIMDNYAAPTSTRKARPGWQVARCSVSGLGRMLNRQNSPPARPAALSVPRCRAAS